MQNVNNLQEVLCYVDYSLILQADVAERAKGVCNMIAINSDHNDNGLLALAQAAVEE